MTLLVAKILWAQLFIMAMSDDSQCDEVVAAAAAGADSDGNGHNKGGRGGSGGSGGGGRRKPGTAIDEGEAGRLMAKSVGAGGH